MGRVTREITLLNITKNPGALVEQIASISYVTQRIAEKIRPKSIVFASGRTVPYSEFKLTEDPVIGEPLPGYKKDDVFVKEILPPSYEWVIKFIIAIGHHKLLQIPQATFLLKNITRKAALHILRYEYLTTNMRSQKYQDQGYFDYLVPNNATPDELRLIDVAMESAQHNYEILRRTNLDPEWSRCPYPNNVAQTMTITTNFRQFRHIFDCLCNDDYVDENMQIAMEMLLILKEKVPEFFFDYRIGGDRASRNGGKVSRNKKVNWMLSPQQKEELNL